MYICLFHFGWYDNHKRYIYDCNICIDYLCLVTNFIYRNKTVSRGIGCRLNVENGRRGNPAKKTLRNEYDPTHI